MTNDQAMREALHASLSLFLANCPRGMYEITAPDGDVESVSADAMAMMVAALAQPDAPVRVLSEWRPIATAPRDGTNILLRFGIDGVSQGKYVAGLPHPWKFIDTNDGVTWLINHSVDAPGGPSHWMPLPDAASSTGASDAK